MKRLFLLWLLCLFLLAGCSQDAESTQPPDADSDFRQSVSAIAAAKNRILGYHIDLKRTVAGEHYRTEVDGTMYCSNLGTEDATVIVEESLTMGTIRTPWSEYYHKGAWCRTADNTFRANMTQEAFMQRQIPAVLITEELYEQVLSSTNADGSTLTFIRPSALESWVPGYPDAQMLQAEATAMLDSEGVLVHSEYRAEYLYGGVTYSLQIRVRVSTPSKLDLSARQDAFPTEGILLDTLDAPKMLMHAAGDLLTARSVSCSVSETLADPAVGLRTRQSTYHLHDFAQALSAYAHSAASRTDLWGLTSSTSQTVTFRGGVFSGLTENSAIVTPEILRTGCEDDILAGLFAPGYLSGATMTQAGDFYILKFTGSDAYRRAILQDLGIGEAENEQITGYLAINKYTRLPTAMGMALENETDSRLYRLDQSLTLSGTGTYRLAAGEQETEEKPAAPISPLCYQVTGSDGQTLWLFGTIHVGDARTAYLPETIRNALAQSDKLVVAYDLQAFEQQINTDEALRAQLAATYYYADGSTLADYLDEELFDAAHDLIFAAGKHNLYSDAMKAVVWNSLLEEFLLQQSHSLCPEKSVDNRLLTLAKAQATPIESFSSGMAQIQSLTSLPESVQALLLKITVQSTLPTYRANMVSLYESWCAGDAAALQEQLLAVPEWLSEAEAELYAQYLHSQVTSQNAAILQAALDHLASEETAFLAVGSAHLYGESGIISGLRAAGYTVTPVREGA